MASILLKGIVGAILVTAIVGVVAERTTESAPAKAAPDPRAEREWQAIQRCQAAILAAHRFHDPPSVEWPGLSRSFRELKAGTYTVQVEVRGKNAFNAKVLNTFECRIRASDLAPVSVRVL